VIDLGQVMLWLAAPDHVHLRLSSATSCRSRRAASMWT